MKRQLAGSAILLAAAMAACAPTERQGADASLAGTLSVASSLRAGDERALEGYARALEPRRFAFPADHGPHPGFKTEWWYWIGNLATPGGRRFGYQITFFRSALAPPRPADPAPEPSAWATSQLYMAHFAVTDVGGSDFHAFERFSRGAAGLAGARAEPFRVWLDDWSVESAGAGDAWRVRAAEGPVEIDLTLEPGKDRVLHGDRGLSRKGDAPGAASYYYSRTRMPTSGIVVTGGEALEVQGTSWFDREWSSSLLGRDEIGWDWLGAQLDDGRDLMFFRLRRKDGTSARVDGTLVTPDGASRPLDTRGHELVSTAGWTSPRTGIAYPAALRLELPAEELAIEVAPLLPDQELGLSFVYWEGAVAISGSVTGRGYLEMTGYGEEASPR